MKIYKTNSGIVIETESKFYLLKNENWDTFTNDDSVFQKATNLCSSLPAVLKQTFLSWTVMETTISVLGLIGVLLLNMVI